MEDRGGSPVMECVQLLQVKLSLVMHVDTAMTKYWISNQYWISKPKMNLNDHYILIIGQLRCDFKTGCFSLNLP